MQPSTCPARLEYTMGLLNVHSGELESWRERGRPLYGKRNMSKMEELGDNILADIQASNSISYMG